MVEGKNCVDDGWEVATAAASVNPIDWKIRSGTRQKDFSLSFPAILGRDVSGVVRAVGANVKHFKPGERVLALSNATYAELVAVDDSDVTHLPDGLDLVDAAGLPLIALTGDQLVRHATGRGVPHPVPHLPQQDCVWLSLRDFGVILFDPPERPQARSSCYSKCPLT